MKKSIVSLLTMLACVTLVSCQGRVQAGGSTTGSEIISSSSKADTDTKHKISLTQVDGVTLSSDKSEAKKGETVTVTVSNVDGSKTVNLKGTPEVEFTQGAEANTYRFVMPDSDVNITAELVAAKSFVESFNFYMRGIQNPPKGSFSVGGSLKTIDQLKAGDKVSLVFTELSASDFPKEKDFYLYVGNDVVSAKVSEVADKGLHLSFEFTVPESKTDIVVVPAAGVVDTAGASIKIDALPQGIKVYGLKEGDKYSANQGLAYFYVHREVGYKTSFQYKEVSGEFQTGQIDSSNFASFPLTADTELKFVSENVGAHKITYVGSEDIVSIDGRNDYVLPESYTVGDTLLLSNILVKDGKYIESITITGADGKEITKLANNPTTAYLTMPDQDVTITFIIKDNGKIGFTGWEEYLQEAPKVIDGYSLLGGKEVTSAPEGKTLSVYIKPKANYKVGALQYGEGKTATFNKDFSNAGYYQASFAMPAGDVTLSLGSISTLHTITIEKSDTEGNSITLNSNEGFSEGETVNFSVDKTDPSYSLKSLVATYGGKSETWTVGKEVTLDSTGRSGSFTMVNGDLSIKPVFEKAQTVDVDVTADADVTFSFRTSVSGSTVDKEGTQKLLPNDQISISQVSTPSTASSKYVQIQVTDSTNKVTNYDPVYLSVSTNSISYNYSSSFAVTGEGGATVKSIRFALVDRPAVKVLINNDTKAKLKFSINDKDATELTALKQYDKLVVKFDETTFEKGYSYSYILKDDKGNPLSSNGADTYLLLTNSPLTLEVIQRKSYTATVNYTPADSDTSNVNWNMQVDGNYSSSLPKTFNEGANVVITSISISNKDYKQYAWSLEVKVGNKTYKSDNNSLLNTPLSFVVEGDVVFNFTLSLS